jgi:hypothetical protein
MKKEKIRKIYGSILVFLGFWLSPLSPWNDLFTNIPMAYGFGFLFSLISEQLFLPMVILGYWLSNVLGFILMHYGYLHVKEKKFSFKKNWKSYVFWTTLYTLVVVVLIKFEILPSAQDVISFFK